MSAFHERDPGAPTKTPVPASAPAPAPPPAPAPAPAPAADAAASAAESRGPPTGALREQERALIADRMATLGTLASGVAHEINNPLTYVLGNLDLIAMRLRGMAAGMPPGRLDDLEAWLADTREGAERIKRIVRDMHTVAHADEGSKRPLDVRSILETVLGMVRNELRHRARLETRLDDVPLVLANEARLSQAFLQLLMNAVQALPEGRAAEHEISVTTGTDAQGRARIDVRDSGPGIPPEVRGRIFDPFFTTKQPGVGTGLGLSVCYGIVRSLGGEIEVESEPAEPSEPSAGGVRGGASPLRGPGARFRVLLPGMGTPVPRVPALDGTGDGPTEGASRRARILIADDEPGVRTLLKHALDEEFDVVAVSSGFEALDLLEKDPSFEAVICDVMMPNIGGREVYERVRMLRPGFERAIIFITGGPFTQEADRFLASLPNPCVQKPFKVTEVESLLRRRVGGPRR